MRLLVTGAKGLVASRLVQQGRARGHDVIAQSRASSSLEDAAQVDRLVDEARPEAIIHPAGLTDVDACERAPDEAYRANVDATVNLARASKRVSAHFTYVSTDYVFDGERGPYAEDALPNPGFVYARTKVMAEQAARLFVPDCVIARTATVCAFPPTSKLNFGAWLVQTLARGERPKLFVDQLVSPSLAANVADMLLDIAEAKHRGTFHVSGADVLTRMQFGERVCEMFGFDKALLVPVAMADTKLAGPRPKRAGLVVGRAKALPHPPLGVEAILRELRREWEAG